MNKAKSNLGIGETQGVTLVEVLIYLAIFGLIFTVIIEFAISIGEYNRKAALRRDLSRTEILVYEHMRDSFNRTDAIDEGNSVFLSDNGRVRLNTTSGYLQYSLVDRRLSFDNNGVSGFLTNPGYVVSSFFIERVERSDGSLVGARIRLTTYRETDPESDLTYSFVFTLRFY